jgi:hypothetical protein
MKYLFPMRRIVSVLSSIVFMLVFLFGCVTPCLRTEGNIIVGNESANESGDLLVVTYNMLHGFGNRLNQQTLGLRLTLLAEEIIRLKPDVVLLQEVSVTQEFRYCNVADALRDTINDELKSEGISYKGTSKNHILIFAPSINYIYNRVFRMCASDENGF